MSEKRPQMPQGKPADPRLRTGPTIASATARLNRQEHNSHATLNSSASMNRSSTGAMQQMRPAPVPTHNTMQRLNAVNIQHRSFAASTPSETVNRIIQPPPHYLAPAPVQPNNFPVIQRPPDGPETASLKQTIKDLEGLLRRERASLAQCQDDLRDERANSKRQETLNKEEIQRLRLRNLELKNQPSIPSRPDQEIESLNAELARAKKDVEFLRREIQQQSYLFDDSEHKREQAGLEFKEEKAKLQEENDSLHAKIVQMKEDLKSQEKKHQVEARRLKEEKSALKKDDVKYDTGEIERHNAEAQKAKDELQRTLNKYKIKIGILDKELKKCEMHQRKFARLTNNLKLEKIEGEKMKEFLENRFQQISESRGDKSASRKVSVHRASSSLSDEERAEFIPQEAYPAATIRTLTHLSKSEIKEMTKSREIWIDDIALFAFISSIAIRSPRRIIVVSPLYTACLLDVPTTRNHEAPALEGAYRNFEEGPYELAIIPVMKSREHWTIAIQEYGEAIQYYDPLPGGSITTKIENRIVQAIEELSCMQAIHVQKVHSSLYNSQTDLVNCGVHCMLIAESYIQNGGKTFLENLHIDSERQRIIRQLTGLLTDDFPPDYEVRHLHG
ncbi:hypothetical protein DdX_11435 [Ditylenchus destructor]|uniref:Ubiquitin-like protease family profile domain-containing protein n=1 Tax=Ditylenchus destructor TaxID=166010 RepID=A0AAD4MXL8_9BILA|nr:hypothetical protein DdX_11435 [Ditylenchus destructor]